MWVFVWVFVFVGVGVLVFVRVAVFLGVLVREGDDGSTVTLASAGGAHVHSTHFHRENSEVSAGEHVDIGASAPA